MKTRTKFVVVDTIFNYFLFTPLVLLFWYGTYLLIDTCLMAQFESRVTGALVSLAVGLFIEFDVTYWQDSLNSRGKSFNTPVYVVYSRLYNYLLAVGNICHYRAIQELYDIYMIESYSLWSAVQTAVTSIVLLWSLRAGRNITAVPFCLSLDADHDSWFTAPVLYQSPVNRPIQHVLDTTLTVGVVWSLGPLFWVTLGYVFDIVVFPDDYNSAMIASAVGGYLAVGLAQFFQDSVRLTADRLHTENRTLLKTLLEDIYIFLATAGVILTWKGVGMAVDLVARQHPVRYGDSDLTGLCANVASFALLSICYVSGSLVGKGAELDGSGLEFSTDYFGHFFGDYVRQSDDVVAKKIN
jgi:hypothetical protein